MKIVIRDQPQLYNPSDLEEFLTIPPFTPDAIVRSHELVKKREYPRAALADILMRYNKSIGNDSVALENIDSLTNIDKVCVLTGQQVGLMGGPLYTILKAITCIQLAKETGAIPIFWAATEDHDIAEIDHTYLVDALGNLKRFRLNFPRKGSFVEDLLLSETHLETIQEFCDEAGIRELLWNPSIKSGDSFGKTMIRLLAKLFVGTGLVFIEPHLLRTLAVPFFCQEICSTSLITKTLQNTTARLHARGGKTPLSYEDKGTNLFYKLDGGLRSKIRYDDQVFCIGDQKYSQEDLIKLCKAQPERFSVNASARVVLQNLLFPVFAYVGGPSEILYYHQLRDYHHLHGIEMPWIIPRLSATLIDKGVAHDLEQGNLYPWDVIHQWQNDIKIAGSEKISSHALHVMHNMLYPQNGQQERLLNWLGFQAKSKENLIRAFLEQTNWKTRGHHYCWL